MVILAAVLLARAVAEPAPPIIKVTADNTVIRESCTLLIDAGTVIDDADQNGVIHIAADGITIEWAPETILRGCAQGTSPDSMTGVGISIRNHSNVTIRGGTVSGFKVGVEAEHTDGLTLDGTVFIDNFRQRLRSTPQAEDSADWLYPHHDDAREWTTRWGAAASVRHATAITIRNIRVRDGQNGILLHRVNDSSAYDNDVSFLSGWGIAMFRSNRNMISRNAADYCIRGHSEGVYNRGQDSAGLLAFEQCSDNAFVENSATHGGDGFFGFAGLEALGEKAPPEGFEFERKGCNDNTFIGNDFSFASAHGLEITFSFGNVITGNHFEGDGICGIWGGYSQDTQVRNNVFRKCGALAYGLERGGVNIEHGANNTIAGNTFEDNACGVHLWWDRHGDFESKPWGRVNYRGTAGNTIAENTFSYGADGVGGGAVIPMLHLRDERAATEPTPEVRFAGNTLHLSSPRAVEVLSDPGIPIQRAGAVSPVPKVQRHPLGTSRPVGRRAFGGRESIIMGEWGPWDFERPFVRRVAASNQAHSWQIFGPGTRWHAVDLETGEETHWSTVPTLSKPLQLTITNPAGLRSYRYRISNGDGWHMEVQGTILGAWWNVRAFNWTPATSPLDNLAAWRALATGEGVFEAQAGSLDLRFGHRGPSALQWAVTDREAPIGTNHFGLIATATLDLPAGRYSVRTTSDDGIRVSVGGLVVLENWSWHAPTKDTGKFEVSKAGATDIVVEYFEIDGFAVLDLAIEPAQ